MKKIIGALLALFSAVAFGATTVPIQLINPAGSTSGQAIVSTGASSAPAWGGVGVNGIAAIAANTVLANATASSASPTAFAMPSCSATGNALNWTTGSGFTCQTGLATLASPTFTGTVTVSNITASGTITGFPGRLLNIQIFTSSGTYTPTTGANKAIVTCQGAGGAGGGTPVTSASQNSVGQAGNSGAYAQIWIASSLATQTVTVGTAGTGSAGAAGGNGGSSSFGSLVSCGGGNGGLAGLVFSSFPAFVSFNITAATVSGSGTFITKQNGDIAVPGLLLTLSNFFAGHGANSPLGTGAQWTGAGAGNAASGYGAAGSGAAAGASTASTQAGGAGSNGIVIVYEYQ